MSSIFQKMFLIFYEDVYKRQKQYNTGKEALADSERDLTQAKEQLEPKEQELAAGWEAYQTGKSEYDTNAAQLESLKGQKDQLEAALTAQGIDPSQNADYLTLAGTIAQMEPALALSLIHIFSVFRNDGFDTWCLDAQGSGLFLCHWFRQAARTADTKGGFLCYRLKT